MKELNIKDTDIAAIDWDDGMYSEIGDEVDFGVDQLVYIYQTQGSSKFGAIKNGKLFASNLGWVIGVEREQQLHNLIENGVPPYEALEFMEL